MSAVCYGQIIEYGLTGAARTRVAGLKDAAPAFWLFCDQRPPSWLRAGLVRVLFCGLACRSRLIDRR